MSDFVEGITQAAGWVIVVVAIPIMIFLGYALNTGTLYFWNSVYGRNGKRVGMASLCLFFVVALFHIETSEHDRLVLVCLEVAMAALAASWYALVYAAVFLGLRSFTLESVFRHLRCRWTKADNAKPLSQPGTTDASGGFYGLGRWQIRLRKDVGAGGIRSRARAKRALWRISNGYPNALPGPSISHAVRYVTSEIG